jgi:diguanylate cyclase (GGDEF)-like protein/PAS domain S-box-containing protein
MNLNRFFRPIGLGSLLALACAGLIVLLTVIILQIIDSQTANRIKARIGHELEELAFQTTDKLDRGLFERYREVQHLAADRTLVNPAVSPDEKRELLHGIQQTYPSYAWIGLADNQGKVLAATGELLEGADVSQRPWFTDAYRGIHVQDVHDAVRLGGLLPNPSKVTPRLFDIAFPYRGKDGAIAGVLGVHLSWQWAREIESSIFRPLANRSQVDTLILARDGTVLLGPAALIGTRPGVASFTNAQTRSGSIVERWGDGKHYVVGFNQSRGYLSYPGLGWTVLVRQELDDAYAPVTELQHTILGIGLAAAAVFSLLALFMARKIATPLRSIARSASAIESGRASTIDVGASGYKEIATLAGALNSLVHKLAVNEASLRQLNASLEQRVEQRTAQLVESERRLATIADNMPAAILYIDRDQRYRFCNKTYSEWYGRPVQSIYGRTVAELFAEQGAAEDIYRDNEPYLRQALSGQRAVFEVQRRIDGASHYLEETYIPHWDSEGEVAGFFAMIQDITERKRQQLDLEHNASHDTLTGLLNRGALMDRIGQAVARAERSQKALAVMFLDLNEFKQINDTHGHATGDKVLVAFAECLKNCVRRSDTVGRLAGDEFVIIAEDLVHDDADAIVIAEKIDAALRAPLLTGDPTIFAATSIGIAVHRYGLETPEALLSRADDAMYEAKQTRSRAWSLAPAP